MLDPGFYLLVAYGGPSQPWAEGSDEQPLWLRWGAPDLGEAGRRRLVMSPFGEDWFRVPDNVNFARLELPEALSAGIRAPLGAHRTAVLQRPSGTRSSITKESVPPAADIYAQDKPADDDQVMEEASEEASEYDEESSYEEESEEEYAEEEESGEGEEYAEEERGGGRGGGAGGAAGLAALARGLGRSGPGVRPAALREEGRPLAEQPLRPVLGVDACTPGPRSIRSTPRRC